MNHTKRKWVVSSSILVVNENARVAAAPDLLDACRYALPLICGERLKNDAFPPDDNLGEYLAGLFETCEKKLERAITKAKLKQANEPERTG
ncbi:hypothetical protein LCGC14_0948830 [marine sediment metagenome]|uniref:Uncharacterized protein n=1 Tax=marine sediment metagenome TaxID=412755 RepID=A0A0F9P3Z5_9ZZZZ